MIIIIIIIINNASIKINIWNDSFLSGVMVRLILVFFLSNFIWRRWSSLLLWLSFFRKKIRFIIIWLKKFIFSKNLKVQLPYLAKISCATWPPSPLSIVTIDRLWLWGCFLFLFIAKKKFLIEKISHKLFIVQFQIFFLITLFLDMFSSSSLFGFWLTTTTTNCHLLLATFSLFWFLVFSIWQFANLFLESFLFSCSKNDDYFLSLSCFLNLSNFFQKSTCVLFMSTVRFGWLILVDTGYWE